MLDPHVKILLVAMRTGPLILEGQLTSTEIPLALCANLL